MRQMVRSSLLKHLVGDKLDRDGRKIGIQARPAAQALRCSVTLRNSGLEHSVVLALVAIFMSLETKCLLIGKAASSEMVEGVRKLIEAEVAQAGAIRRVHAIRTMHLGPNDVLAAVRLDFDDGNGRQCVAPIRTTTRFDSAPNPFAVLRTEEHMQRCQVVNLKDQIGA